VKGPITASKKPRALQSGAVSAFDSKTFLARSGSTATRLAHNPTAINAAIAAYEIRQPKWFAAIRISASETSTANR